MNFLNIELHSIKNTNRPVMKWAKNMKKQLTAKQMVGKEINRCLISLVIKSVEIKLE